MLPHRSLQFVLYPVTDLCKIENTLKMNCRQWPQIMSWSILIFRNGLRCASSALEHITAIRFKYRRTGSAVLRNCLLECIPAYWVFITSALYNCSFVCRWQTAHCRLLARTKGHWIRCAEEDGQRWQGKKRQWTECLSLPSCVCASAHLAIRHVGGVTYFWRALA